MSTGVPVNTTTSVTNSTTAAIGNTVIVAGTRLLQAVNATATSASVKLKSQSNHDARGGGGEIFGRQVRGGLEENNDPNLKIP